MATAKDKAKAALKEVDWKEKFVDTFDQWAVQTKEATFIGALVGVMFFVTLIIYAIVLGIILATSPPIETSAQESTAKRIYEVTLRCASVSEVARDVPDAFAEYFGGPPDEGYYGGGPTGGGGSGYYGSGGGGGAFCPDGSFADSEADCCVYTTCTPDNSNKIGTGTGPYCPDSASSFRGCYFCDSCDVCLFTNYGETCQAITFEEFGTGKRGVTQTGGPFAAAKDTCLVKYKWAKGSKCYEKGKDAEVSVTMNKGEEKVFTMCAPRAGKDTFTVDLSQTTKLFIRGNESDYEMSGIAGFEEEVLVTRVRTNDQVAKSVDDLWFGFILNSKDVKNNTKIVIKFAPLFSVILQTAAFQPLPWLGQISGISNLVGAFWGVVLAVLLSTVFKGRQNESPFAKRDVPMSDIEKKQEPVAEVKVEEKTEPKEEIKTTTE